MGALDGKAIVITGAGRGLGEAYARLCAGEGAQVVVNDIDRDCAEAVAEAIRGAGGAAWPSAHDIGDWDESAALIALCIDAFGAIDGLVNNAGLFHMATPEEETRARTEAIVRVNVLGSMNCGLHALKAMRAAGRGAIVNVTSGAQCGLAGMALYGATKGAVASLTYGWAADAAESGVRVNAVSPIARTRMYDEMLKRGDPRSAPAGLEVRPEENAAAVAYLLSDAAAGINGQVLRIAAPKLSLMTHPAECSGGVSQEGWTVEDVAGAFDARFRGQLQPVGLVVAGSDA
ncbi:MAG: SDR family oxidoreductase [Vannielia sp.]|uniref:SDR family NAD(P)-dependent oxidoreductase n=1 Tax=Vannielia sp. TaxID=2813045 RepID=UPI003B8C3399